jgi:polysaccharide biosynthesis protein PslE
MERIQIFYGKELPLLEPPSDERQDRIFVFFNMFFKHKRLITSVFTLMTLPILSVLLLLPTQYLAKTKILINPTRTFLSLSPSGTAASRTSDGNATSPNPEAINDEIQIIKSKELEERLAKEVPPPSKDASSELKATPVRQASVIEVSLTSPHPEWAISAVNRAAELYLEEQLKVRKTKGVEEFYDEQQKRLQSELTKAESALREFQEKEGIVDASIEVPSDLQALASFEKNLKETDSTIRETEEKIASLDGQLRQQQATISTNKNIGINPVYLQIMDKITKLELDRDNLLQRYTPTDRLVMDKEKEIEELKERLKSVEATKVGSESISLNDVHRRILNELLAAKVQLRSLKEKKDTLTKQVAEYSSTTAEKKQRSYEYDRLLQDVAANKKALDLYRQKAEEARISNAMDERKFANAVILEKATPPLERAGVNGISLWVLIPGTLILSLGVAIGAAFLIDYFPDTTLKDEAEVEAQTGLPVLATIKYHAVEHCSGVRSHQEK